MSDQFWKGCVIPDGLLYDVGRNVWVRLEGRDAVLGMTDVAQTMCGKLVQISWKVPGRKVVQGKPLAVIESAKWVGPFQAPFGGEIVENNQAAFDEDILVANRDPYGAGWLVRLRPDDFEAERDHLLDGPNAYEQYRRLIDENDLHCYRCAE